MTQANPSSDFHACIVKNGQVVLTQGRPDTLFPWWSFSKTVLAAIALRAGVDLNLPLPNATYTLHQLLTHTARLPCYCDLPEYHSAVAAGETAWGFDDMEARVMSLPPKEQPAWRYSNYGYALARRRIENLSGKTLAEHMQALANHLGLNTVFLAETMNEFSKVHWPEAKRYDPKWVYHGCLVGTPAEAALMMDAIATGRLLSPDQFRTMNTCVDLGGALEGRPWTRCRYGLGVMSGEMGNVGRAIGHSGSGPFSSNAVYHFPDLPEPTTVAVFGHGSFEGHSENHIQTLINEKARHP